MNENLLVDTDVMIDLLRGHADAVTWVRQHTRDIALSAITVAELTERAFRELSGSDGVPRVAPGLRRSYGARAYSVPGALVHLLGRSEPAFLLGAADELGGAGVAAE